MFNQRRRMHYSPFDTDRRQGSLAGKASRFIFIVFSVCLLVALILLSISSCQDSAANIRILPYASKNTCEFRYEGVGLTLIENHCGTNKGVYFMTPQGMYTAPLINPAVNTLVQKHGCDAPNKCVFNLNIQADYISGQFSYVLNGQDGFYQFDWPRDQQPVVTDSSPFGGHKG